MTPIKLVILGRDGVLNEYREDHIKAPEEWVPVPGALEALSRLNHAGWHTVVATNQSGIGRGLLDMASVNAVHARMNQLLMAQGGRIDAVFFCPHAPDVECACRKPLPGMMKDIGRRFGVDLNHVPLVSDTLRDMQAAQAAGCEPHLVRSGRAAALDDAALERLIDQVPATQVHNSLGEFADWLLRRELTVESSSMSLNA